MLLYNLSPPPISGPLQVAESNCSPECALDCSNESITFQFTKSLPLVIVVVVVFVTICCCCCCFRLNILDLTF